MKEPYDLCGQRFGRLVAVRFDSMHSFPNGKRGQRWLVRCDCGREFTVLRTSIRDGHTNSCGCLESEKLSARNRTHDKSRSATYRTWASMMARTSIPSASSFKYYGGRGIKVCERWHAFENFLADMGERPSPKHSIDRFPDQDGDYEPGNVRWAFHKAQMRNMSRNHLIEFEGEKNCIAHFAERFAIDPTVLLKRIRRGWTVPDALQKPLRVRAHQ